MQSQHFVSQKNGVAGEEKHSCVWPRDKRLSHMLCNRMRHSITNSVLMLLLVAGPIPSTDQIQENVNSFFSFSFDTKNRLNIFIINFDAIFLFQANRQQLKDELLQRIVGCAFTPSAFYIIFLILFLFLPTNPNREKVRNVICHLPST